MTVFVAVILAVLTFAFIMYPLFRERRRLVDSGREEELQRLYSSRDTAYAMLKELEFDFQSGVLSEKDYRELEKSYQRKAISVLKDIDNAKKGTSEEDEIEKQVQALRRSKGRFCPQCGAEYQKDDRFCSHCGTALGQGKRID